jgi:glycosyltransferase involved in cell wall biosynthesis
MVGLERFAERAGGLNRYVEHLVSALRAQNAQVLLLATGTRPDSGPGDDGILAVTPSRLWPIRLLRLWWASQRVAPDIDVLDIHFALHGWLITHVGRLRHTPLMVHFQGPWAEEGAVEGAGSWTTVAKRALERSVYRKADTLVALSGAFKDLLIEDYGIAASKIQVIPPGVDLVQFTPGDKAAARQHLHLEADRIVLVVRRLVPRMGHAVLLKAWSLLCASDPSNSPALVIVGTGPSEAALRAEVHRLGLGGIVTFVGAVDADALTSYYQSADLTVVPSTDLEGFGLVVLESLASGTPVIASRIGGLADAMAPLGDQFLVPPGDHDALAETVAMYFASPRLSVAACRSLAEDFSWDAVARSHQPLYLELGDEQTGRPVRVVYLSHTAQMSGGELALARLLSGLTPWVEPHVILAEDGPLVQQLEASGISVEVMAMQPALQSLARDRVMPGRLPIGAAWHALRYIVRLFRRLRQLNPDLVHTNSLKSLVYGLCAGKAARRIVVVHVRDRMAADYLPPAAIAGVRLLCRWLPDGIIANSAITMSTLPKLRCPSASISSPVELGEFSGMDRLPGTGPLVIAMVGRIAPWKGQDLFLRAFADAFPSGDETALLVGSAMFGEDAYEAELHTLADTLGITDRVAFRGYEERVSMVLKEVDVLVHASVIPEPFGQVVVEGLAAGLCVIAANEGGPASIITDGVDGILCKPRDVHAYAAALTRVQTDPELRFELGRAARTAAQRFATPVVAEEVLALYRLAAPALSGRLTAADAPSLVPAEDR